MPILLIGDLREMPFAMEIFLELTLFKLDVGTKEGIHGLYIRAFCEGLDQVLNAYRQLLLDIERELLEDPNLTITYVSSALEEVI